VVTESFGKKASGGLRFGGAGFGGRFGDCSFDLLVENLFDLAVESLQILGVGVGFDSVEDAIAQLEEELLLDVGAKGFELEQARYLELGFVVNAFSDFSHRLPLAVKEIQGDEELLGFFGIFAD
jgi:hypothetical protein